MLAPELESAASIRPDLPASASFRALSGLAVRLWLLWEAAFHPDKEFFVSHAAARRELRASPGSICKAFKELEAAGIISKLREGCRPGRMGSQRPGRAALYLLPHRMPGSHPLPWKGRGDPSFRGFWRIHNKRLRSMAASLSAPEAKIWADLHACHRNKDGSPEDTERFSVSAGAVAEKLGLSKATAQRALAKLQEHGVIKIVEKGAGRAPTTYRLGGAEIRGVRSGRRKSRSGSGMISLGGRS